ncbi:hypothetical protein B0G57_11740 [Trinickia symbiotica]|uniref:Uncharacterized protein n=1 Tax=Trinickia symbiotica TaxID=863227 RepID=A0A2N7X6N5_9BURK|nr:hypothetical protein [Trinickia symbiotica]PMS37270.1 hypothetical protein C0Z20_08075 [Trinickia symbiotica]PPK42649.1 hypothetical protein B0G57_11740 [Trinickia symbiotica]
MRNVSGKYSHSLLPEGTRFEGTRLNVAVNQAQTLVSPWLFQAPDLVLDLINIDPRDPVVVSVLLPDAVADEHFVVTFGDTEKDAKAGSARRFVNDVLFQRNELPALSDSCVVSCSFRDLSSQVTIALRDSSSASASCMHAGSFYGTYVSGFLDAWVLPTDCRLLRDAPVIRTMGPAARVSNPPTLPIGRRTPTDQTSQIGEITFDADVHEWKIDIFDDVDLQTGDLLSIEVPPGPPAWLAFSVSL